MFSVTPYRIQAHLHHQNLLCAAVVRFALVELELLVRRGLHELEAEVPCAQLEQFSRSVGGPRLVGDVVVRGGLGDGTFAIGAALAVVGAEVVPLEVKIPVSLGSLAVAHLDFGVGDEVEVIPALELLRAVVREDDGCGHRASPKLSQQGWDLVVEQLGHDVLHPRTVLSPIVADHLERVRPDLIPPPEVDRDREDGDALMLPVLRLHLVLLAHGELLLEVGDEEDLPVSKVRQVVLEGTPLLLNLARMRGVTSEDRLQLVEEVAHCPLLRGDSLQRTVIGTEWKVVGVHGANPRCCFVVSTVGCHCPQVQTPTTMARCNQQLQICEVVASNTRLAHRRVLTRTSSCYVVEEVNWL